MFKLISKTLSATVAIAACLAATPATAAPEGWVEIDAGACKVLGDRETAQRNSSLRREWIGGCVNGYAEGPGVHKVFDASGRLLHVGQFHFTQGRVNTAMPGERYSITNDGRIARATVRGPVQLVAASDLPVWAETLVSTATNRYQASASR